MRSVISGLGTTLGTALGRLAIAGGLAAGLAACSLGETGAARKADTAFVGGVIYTARDDAPRVQAVGIAQGRIVFAGGRSEIEPHLTDTTRIIDLDGKAMFPGFTDAHAHLYGIGERELTLNLDSVSSVAGLVSAVEEAAAATPEGQLIEGRGWIETHWPEERFPSRDDIDPVTPDNPALLTRADGHALLANSRALEAAGITDETPDPAGGRIERDASGRATGILVDNAMGLVAGLRSAPGEARRREVLRTATQRYVELGWTGIHDMSVPMIHVDLMEDMAGGDDGFAPLRIYASINPTPEGAPKGAEPATARALIASGPRRSQNGQVVTRAIKLYMDGALGSRGAALLEPYSDAPETSGLLLMEKAAVMPLLESALREGIQINTHAIGDLANRMVLDWYEEAFAAVPEDERKVAEPRWRIEHAQVIHPVDIERFARLGVIASMQPSHAIGDLHFAVDRLGIGRMRGTYAWSSLAGTGAIVAGGSDAPVEKGNPLIEFYAAAVRKDADGFSGEGWFPGEAVSRQTALKMFTAWPAYASFTEDETGTIETGKRADFTVFSKDIMSVAEDEILTAEPVMTIIGGEIVYEKSAPQ